MRTRLLLALGISTAAYFLGLFRDSAHSIRTDTGLWLVASAALGVYAFFVSGATVLTIWSDFVQVDDWGESVLLDRSQQDRPFYDHDEGAAWFGSGNQRVHIGKRLSADDLALVEQAFLTSQGARPERFKTTRISGWWSTRLSSLLFLLPAMLVLLYLDVPDRYAIPVLAVAAATAVVAAELWQRAHPRFKDLGAGSG